MVGGGVMAWGWHLKVLSGGRRWRDAAAARPSSGGAKGTSAIEDWSFLFFLVFSIAL
jgi:hypothetical protein